MRIVDAANVTAPAYLAILSKGYAVRNGGGLMIAERDGNWFAAEGPRRAARPDRDGRNQGRSLAYLRRGDRRISGRIRLGRELINGRFPQKGGMTGFGWEAVPPTE